MSLFLSLSARAVAVAAALRAPARHGGPGGHGEEREGHGQELGAAGAPRAPLLLEAGLGGRPVSLRDPVVQEILALVKKVQKKTKIYERRGTYRMRAWIIPEGKEGDSKVRQANPFGRQGA